MFCGCNLITNILQHIDVEWAGTNIKICVVITLTELLTDYIEFTMQSFSYKKKPTQTSESALICVWLGKKSLKLFNTKQTIIMTAIK